MNVEIAIPKKERWTYADYADLTPPDTVGFEVIQGELIVAPAPKPKHQWVSGELFSQIRAFVIQHDLGRIFLAPLDVILDANQPDPVNIVQPDLFFISKERLNIVTDTNVKGAPDLMVEILSDSSTRRDRVQKMNLYAEYGVIDYWIVDTDAQTLEAFHLSEDVPRLAATHSEGDVFRPEMFKGLDIQLADVWYLEDQGDLEK